MKTYRHVLRQAGPVCFRCLFHVPGRHWGILSRFNSDYRLALGNSPGETWVTFCTIHHLLLTVCVVVSVPFQSIDGNTTNKFRSAVFLGTCQSALSSISALVYILIRRKSDQTFSEIIGLDTKSLSPVLKANNKQKAAANGRGPASPPRSQLLLRFLQCSMFITTAAPFGFAALSYITYPAMVLGKSCKLVPVMLMNVLLYRRKFAPHKYLVVFMVTVGITIFMGFGNETPKKASSGTTSKATPYANLIGIGYLLINLALDGATNSTQDEIFSQYNVTGQQMMFWINLFCTILTVALSVLPLPYIPVVHPTSGGHSELMDAITFIRSHPSIITPLAQFALTGALGQLFIFETLQHFGSLTLV